MATVIGQDEGEAFQAKETSGLTFERTKEGLENRKKTKKATSKGTEKNMLH